jgi:hypothetical protein
VLLWGSYFARLGLEKPFLADLLMVALVPIALWPVILVFLLKDRAKKRRARYWPATRGRIDQVDVQWMVGEDCYYAAQIGYSYQVGGQRYSGTLAKRCADENTGLKLVESLKNKPVVVRYQPRRPDENVLFIDENPMFKRTASAARGSRPSLN